LLEHLLDCLALEIGLVKEGPMIDQLFCDLQGSSRNPRIILQCLEIHLVGKRKQRSLRKVTKKEIGDSRIGACPCPQKALHMCYEALLHGKLQGESATFVWMIGLCSPRNHLLDDILPEV